MKPGNIKELQKAFSIQAENFDSVKYHLSKKEYLDYLVAKTSPRMTDNILEVAAGTGVCARALAPYAAHIICVDATPAMLKAGKTECDKEGINNITMMTGYAEELPFLDDSFDIVVTRLSFHHFVNPEIIFAEMRRVLRPDGKLVIMDMVPGDETLRDEIDRIETLRDPSHVRDITLSEIKDLYLKNKMTIDMQEQTDIPVSLTGWMELTKTPEDVKKEIIALMNKDIDGTYSTGFAPYLNNDEIYFTHHWVLNVGRK